MKTYIIPTAKAEHIGRKLAGKKGAKVIFLEKNKDGKRSFPDAEIYMRLKNRDRLKNNRVMILHSGAPDPNGGLMELFMLLDLMKNIKCRKEIFFTYFPYGMQDEIFEEGEINVAESLLKKLTKYYGVSKIYVLDAHFFGKKWTDHYPLENFSAVEILKRASKKDFPDAVFISPDDGGEKRSGLFGPKKIRKNSYSTKIKNFPGRKELILGKTLGVVDDILETGGTLEKFHDFAKKSGAGKIFALITHGVLREGIERIEKKYDRVYLTNSVDIPSKTIDVSGLVHDIIVGK